MEKIMYIKQISKCIKLTKSKIIFKKRLNLELLPKDILYNDISYNDTSKQMLESMEILEKAKIQKFVSYENKEEEPTFWSKFENFMNPFKCAGNNNNNKENE